MDNDNKEIKDNTDSSTRGSQIYSVNAMACRRVSLVIETIPLDPVTTTTTTEVPETTIVKKDNITLLDL